MAYISITAAQSCPDYNIDNISIITEIRDQPDTDGEIEEFRRILKVQTSKQYQGVTAVGNAAVVPVDHIDGTLNGAINTFTVLIDADMSDFQCINQEITPVQDQGFDVMMNKAEWISIGNDGEWQEIEWDSIDLLPPGTIPTVTVDGVEGAAQSPSQVEYFGEEMETRTDPDDENAEQYRMYQRLVITRELYSVTSLSIIDSKLWWDYMVQAAFNSANSVDIYSNRDTNYGYYILAEWSLSCIDVQGSKKVINRLEYISKTQWQTLTWV